MAVFGVRYDPRTVDYLRPGESLCFGCKMRECDEKAEGCEWRRRKEGKRLVTAFWATEPPAESDSLRVVGTSFAIPSAASFLWE